MKVTLKNTVKYGGKYHKPGTTIDCKKDVAESLIKAGAADHPRVIETKAEPQQPEEPPEQNPGDQDNDSAEE
jgi:thiamine pyrophosphate-dependent acetolactate synthase large subunit-like protein